MKLLSAIERAGNKLPDPASLFIIGLVAVMLISALASSMNWSVTTASAGEIRAVNLLSAEGLWWLLSNMVQNFIKFPPLAIVLVGMLGIGLAEQTGLLPTVLRFFITHVADRLLTPATLLAGILSSIALDAGYVVLPPVAAALYIAAGRSPLAGIAAAFAGISAGFSANLSITPLDPLLAGFTESAAQFLDKDYAVADTANWWFMIASTITLTLAGWWISDKIVEPRLRNTVAGKNLAEQAAVLTISDRELSGMRYAGLTLSLLIIITVAAIMIPDWPLFGSGKKFDRWIEVIVPLLFFYFAIPGIVFGVVTGAIKSDKDAAKMMGNTIARLGSYIVLAFFAAQFIEAFKYSGLGGLLAVTGGQLLVDLQINNAFLIGCFVLMAVLANLLIGSASAKYAFIAPVFVPMLMQTGISPELTQAAYRVGDSVSNVVTPLNPYMIIILAQFQRHLAGSGFGTLIAVMLPYAIGFFIVWIGLLLIWMMTGIPLGPGGVLDYTP